jgi:hypothetical protein
MGGRGTIAPRVLNFWIRWRKIISFTRRLLYSRGTKCLLGMPQSQSGSFGQESTSPAARNRTTNSRLSKWVYFFSHGSRGALVGQGVLLVKASQSHSRYTTPGAAPQPDAQTTRKTHKRQTSPSPVGFEPTTPASERPQTHALDSAAKWVYTLYNINLLKPSGNFTYDQV